jgi:hypothetical protein
MSIWCDETLWYLSEGPCSKLEAMTSMVQLITGGEDTISDRGVFITPQELLDQTTRSGHSVYSIHTVDLDACHAAGINPQEEWGNDPSDQEDPPTLRENVKPYLLD